MAQTVSEWVNISLNCWYKIMSQFHHMLFCRKIFSGITWWRLWKISQKKCSISFVILFLFKGEILMSGPIKIAQINFLLDENNVVFFDLTSKNNWCFCRRNFLGQKWKIRNSFFWKAAKNVKHHFALTLTCCPMIYMGRVCSIYPLFIVPSHLSMFESLLLISTAT